MLLLFKVSKGMNNTPCPLFMKIGERGGVRYEKWSLVVTFVEGNVNLCLKQSDLQLII